MTESDPTVGEVFDRLAADPGPSDEVKDLVIGALTDDLAAAIGGAVTTPERAPVLVESPEPTRAYLGKVSVRGFRGIGPESVLPLSPGPGLTLVVGRNGSGKSSFAEAVELALTGECSRWDGRNKVWKEGWANLHTTDDPRVAVDICVDGEAGTSTVVGRWSGTDDVAGAEWAVRRDGSDAPWASLGWQAPMGLYRPFLSYNELGSLLEEGPSKLFDALASILGLEPLTDAADRLAVESKARTKAATEAKQRAKQLEADLRALDDDRAQRAADCLKGTKWDLVTLTSLAVGEDDTAAGLESTHLARLIELPAPDPARAAQTAAAIRAALAGKEALRGTDADRAHRTAALLDAAVELHRGHGDQPCPVCGKGSLDDARVQEIEAEANALRAEAGAARAADGALTRALEDARRLLAAVPSALAAAAAAGVSVDLAPAREAWARWFDAPAEEDPAALADHLDAQPSRVVAATEAVIAAARARHEELEDQWRPLAAQIGAFLPAAEATMSAAVVVKRLKDAKTWLDNATIELRRQRFAPVADQVRQTWEVLRQNSSVEIGEVMLAGKGTQRRVDVKVNVDDVDGVALGVMSQGELHALALSLFVPRATLPASPFGFLLIDDPVQAMDPARVDGLAVLLAELAETRQVVVFTHDDRLPDAARRLELNAKVIEVTRRPNSVVETRVARHPAKTYLDDARAVTQSAQAPADIVRRVVPGLCRHAIEAAGVDKARRLLLASGMPHADIEAQFAERDGLVALLALALFGDGSKGSEVYASLRNQYGAWAVDAVRSSNKGAHAHLEEAYGKGPEALDDLVKDARRLVDRLAAS